MSPDATLRLQLAETSGGDDLAFGQNRSSLEGVLLRRDYLKRRPLEGRMKRDPAYPECGNESLV